MIDHHQLIKKLANDALPVRPLPSTGRRFFKWLVMALPLAIIFSVFVHRGLTDWHQPGAGLALLQLLVAVSIAIAAVWNALILVIPGREGIPIVRFILGGGLWLLLNIISIPQASTPVVHEHGTFCYLFLLVVSLPMIVTLLWTLHKSGGLRSTNSLLMAGIGASAWAMSLLSLCHSVQQDRFDLLMHVAAVVTIISLTLLIGRIVKLK
ncbi:NrsF family protein [Rosenbergiella australiborealis]|uniref:DUF1109 domain-containing protein n=1 Tax=Rosenbergiella australiborealis TaxID=1544696 RepID=A0ABS5T619_9GAMM|nr:NrsF family protein [Rosenbergiella australiborealis]MBT0727794.1 DUF1109 domain-containing protein [Rosenbergiella australiborealis]